MTRQFLNLSDDNWGSLKVRAKLSDFTQNQWNKIIFSFISDKKRQRERLEKLSATGDVQLNQELTSLKQT